MYKNLAIFEKTYEFVLWIYPRVNKFPKSQRFVLGQRIENITLEMLEGFIEANQKRNKISYLKKMSMKLDVLRVLYNGPQNLDNMLRYRNYDKFTQKAYCPI